MPAIRPTSSKSLLSRLALLAMLLCCGARPLRADDTQPVLTAQIKEEAEFDSSGNCSSDFELNFSPDLYKHINLILERTSVTMRDGKPEVTATRAPVGSVLRFLALTREQDSSAMSKGSMTTASLPSPPGPVSRAAPSTRPAAGQSAR